jgi:hypothetical protein
MYILFDKDKIGYVLNNPLQCLIYTPVENISDDTFVKQKQTNHRTINALDFEMAFLFTGKAHESLVSL